VESEPVLREVGLAGQRLHQRRLRGLGHHEPRTAIAFLAAEDAGDGDDAAPFALAHVRKAAADKLYRNAGILLIDLFPYFSAGIGNIFIAPAAAPADVVDQNIGLRFSSETFKADEILGVE